MAGKFDQYQELIFEMRREGKSFTTIAAAVSALINAPVSRSGVQVFFENRRKKIAAIADDMTKDQVPSQVAAQVQPGGQLPANIEELIAARVSAGVAETMGRLFMQMMSNQAGGQLPLNLQGLVAAQIADTVGKVAAATPAGQPSAQPAPATQPTARRPRFDDQDDSLPPSAAAADPKPDFKTQVVEPADPVADAGIAVTKQVHRQVQPKSVGAAKHDWRNAGNKPAGPTAEEIKAKERAEAKAALERATRF